MVWYCRNATARGGMPEAYRVYVSAVALSSHPYMCIGLLITAALKCMNESHNLVLRAQFRGVACLPKLGTGSSLPGVGTIEGNDSNKAN